MSHYVLFTSCTSYDCGEGDVVELAATTRDEALAAARRWIEGDETVVAAWLALVESIEEIGPNVVASIRDGERKRREEEERRRSREQQEARDRAEYERLRAKFAAKEPDHGR